MRRLFLALIFLGLAAGTAAVLRFAMPLSPQKALAAAFAQLRDAEHLSGVATVAMLLPQGAAGEAPGDERKPLALRGAFRFDVPREGRPSGEVTLRTVEDDGMVGIVFDLRATADGMTYFNAANLPPGMLGKLSLNEIDGIWWSLDREALATLLAAEAAPSAGDADASWARLRDLALGGSMFVTDGAVTRERVAGKMAYRYVLGVQREAAQSFAKDLRAALLGRPLTETEAADAAADALTHAVRVTAWVDPKDGTPLQLQIDADSEDGSGAMQSINLESLHTGTVAGVTAPEGAKPFDALLEKLLPARK